MKAAEQQSPSQTAVLREEISGVAISWKRVALYVTLSLGFFMLGLVPMWLKAGSAIEQRDAAQREVRLSQLKNSLGTAMFEIQRGDYEPARQTMSDFFTHLRSQIDAGNNSVFTESRREVLRPLLSERDGVITLLARSDPAASYRLSTFYSSYVKLAGDGG